MLNSSPNPDPSKFGNRTVLPTWCPDRVLFSVNHSQASNAIWMIDSIRELVKKWPEKTFRFWRESLAPEGMIQDAPTLQFALSNGTLGKESSKLNWDFELMRIPLRHEVSELFRPLYNQSVAKMAAFEQLNKANPNFLLERYGSKQAITREGVHIFAEYDIELERGIHKLHKEGVKFIIDWEVAPFEGCMATLQSNVQLTIASALLGVGRANDALLHTVGASLLLEQSSRLRDIAFHARLTQVAQPGEVQLIERGYQHGSNIKRLQSDLVEFVDPAATEDVRGALISAVTKFNLVDILKERSVRSPHFEHVARFLLETVIHNTVVQLFECKSIDFPRRFPHLSTMMSGNLLSRWCAEVIDGKPRPGPMEVIKDTLEWLVMQTPPESEIGARARKGVELYQAAMRKRGFV